MESLHLVGLAEHVIARIPNLFRAHAECLRCFVLGENLSDCQASPEEQLARPVVDHIEEITGLKPVRGESVARGMLDRSECVAVPGSSRPVGREVSGHVQSPQDGYQSAYKHIKPGCRKSPSDHRRSRAESTPLSDNTRSTAPCLDLGDLLRVKER